MAGSTASGVPSAGAPLVNDKGLVTQAWLQFLITLWNRTGGAAGGGTGNITTSSEAIGLPYYPDDTAAAAGGVPQWGFYLNDSGLSVRRMP